MVRGRYHWIHGRNKNAQLRSRYDRYIVGDDRSRYTYLFRTDRNFDHRKKMSPTLLTNTTRNSDAEKQTTPLGHKLRGVFLNSITSIHGHLYTISNNIFYSNLNFFKNFRQLFLLCCGEGFQNEPF